MAFTFISCNNDKFIVLIEKPHHKELTNVPMKLYIDGTNIYSDSLEVTNIASIYEEVFYENVSEGNYKLKVEIEDETFEYDINYPNDKYIIISPTLKDNRFLVGILKNDKKYELE